MSVHSPHNVSASVPPLSTMAIPIESTENSAPLITSSHSTEAGTSIITSSMQVINEGHEPDLDNNPESEFHVDYASEDEDDEFSGS